MENKMLKLETAVAELERLADLTTPAEFKKKVDKLALMLGYRKRENGINDYMVFVEELTRIVAEVNTTRNAGDYYDSGAGVSVLLGCAVKSEGLLEASRFCEWLRDNDNLSIDLGLLNDKKQLKASLEYIVENIGDLGKDIKSLDEVAEVNRIFLLTNTYSYGQKMRSQMLKNGEWQGLSDDDKRGVAFLSGAVKEDDYNARLDIINFANDEEKVTKMEYEENSWWEWQDYDKIRKEHLDYIKAVCEQRNLDITSLFQMNKKMQKIFISNGHIEDLIPNHLEDVIEMTYSGKKQDELKPDQVESLVNYMIQKESNPKKLLYVIEFFADEGQYGADIEGLVDKCLKMKPERNNNQDENQVNAYLLDLLNILCSTGMELDFEGIVRSVADEIAERKIPKALFLEKCEGMVHIGKDSEGEISEAVNMLLEQLPEAMESGE